MVEKKPVGLVCLLNQTGRIEEVHYQQELGKNISAVKDTPLEDILIDVSRSGITKVIQLAQKRKNCTFKMENLKVAIFADKTNSVLLVLKDTSTISSFVAIVNPTLPEPLQRLVNQRIDELLYNHCALSEKKATQYTALLGEYKEFIYRVSHDLKAPIRGINKLVEWLVEELEKDNLTEDVRDYLRLLGEKSKSLSELLEGLLIVSRAVLGPESWTKVYLDEYFFSIVHRIFSESQVAFVLDVPHRDCLLETNQLGNALKHLILTTLENMGNESEGILSLTIEVDEDRFTITVEDNGPSRPNDLDMANRSFSKSHKQGKEQKIDLMVFQKIIQLQGEQTANYTSTLSNGFGNRIVFTWPIKIDHVSPNQSTDYQ